MSKKPLRVSDALYQGVVESIVEELLERAGLELPEGWTVWCTKHQGGLCDYRAKHIRIPQAAVDGRYDRAYGIEQNYGVATYFVAHELAHIFAGPATNHGPVFMQWLKRLCPPEYVHCEIAYKPGEAVSAGIVAGPRQAKQLGLPEDIIGQVFSYGGEWYTITNLAPTRRKFPVIATNKVGKSYAFPAKFVRDFFNPDVNL